MQKIKKLLKNPKFELFKRKSQLKNDQKFNVHSPKDLGENDTLTSFFFCKHRTRYRFPQDKLMSHPIPDYCPYAQLYKNKSNKLQSKFFLFKLFSLNYIRTCLLDQQYRFPQLLDPDLVSTRASVAFENRYCLP